MPKNIVICCDGTGNEFGENNTNVIKLYTTLVRDPEKQLAYYHPGLGTAGSMDDPGLWGRFKGRVRKLRGLASGYGIFTNVAHAYRFLIENYNPGDRIFLFGFSRGAYTVKALSGLIYKFGILEKGNDVLIEYAVGLYVKHSARNFKIAHGFQSAFGRDVELHFVGLWDCVSSVGWFWDFLKLPYTWENPDIKTGRHALSLDERRCFFRQHSWGQPKSGQDIKEVWFSGVHSDVGGGYPEKESQLSKISLEWMLNEAETAGILVDQDERVKILGGDPNFTKPDVKSASHESLISWWWIPEYFPKRYWDSQMNPPGKRIMWPRGRHRFVPEGALIHKSVLSRKDDFSVGYKPKNLPQKYEIERG